MSPKTGTNVPRTGGCLVIKNDGMGDMALAIELLNDLSREYGGALDVVCCDVARPIVERNVRTRRIYSVSRDLHYTWPRLDQRAFWSRSKDLAKALLLRPDKRDIEVRNELARTSYDFALVLRRFVRQSTFFFMGAVNAKRKVACWQYPTNISSRSATQNTSGWEHVVASHDILHEMEYYDAIYERTLGRKIEHKCNQGGGRSIGVFAFVLGNVKKGPSPEIWKTVMRAFLQEGRKVEIYGGRDTEKSYSSFSLDNGVRLNTADVGVLTSAERIRETAVLAIGNDTGLMHLVDGVPVTVFCSGETPFRFFPKPNHEEQYVIHRGVPCMDCGYCRRDRRYCVDFSATEIIAMVRLVLQRKLHSGVTFLPSGGRYAVAHRWVDGLVHPY